MFIFGLIRIQKCLAGHKFVENFKGDVQFWWAWYNGCYYYVNETITSRRNY